MVVKLKVVGSSWEPQIQRNATDYDWICSSLFKINQSLYEATSLFNINLLICHSDVMNLKHSLHLLGKRQPDKVMRQIDDAAVQLHH